LFRNEESKSNSPVRKEGIIMLFAPKEKGQGLIEYAIILSLVAVLVVLVVRALGPEIGRTYSSINSSLP
jgi:pilus assembly protein Flp/PilA